MLEFFRRYQRFFYLVITIVIVISFSFFGTFQAAHGAKGADEVAFSAIDGSKVYQSELYDMVTFLSRDARDAELAQNPMAANSFNDGVIADDILRSGIGSVLVKQYEKEVSQDWATKLEREKRYRPYVHPKAQFISADQVWAYYAPEIKESITKVQMLNDQSPQDLFNAKAKLFLAQRDFPPAYLKQFLRYQESMYKWVPQDQDLPYRDVSLFGYQSVQEWFSKEFIEVASRFIINAARLAEKKGYSVSKEEVQKSLYSNVQEFYRRATQEANTSMSPGEFYQAELRRLGMDQGRLMKIWKDVLLFRQFFFDNADSILVDPLVFQDFYANLNEYADLVQYKMNDALQFQTKKDLEKFVLFMSIVSSDFSQQSPRFVEPKKLRAVADIQKEYPELVEKKYLISFKEANKEELQTKVSVQETWRWQTADANWKELEKKYPELEKQAKTVEERLQLLDSLDPAKRAMVDSFSRREIVSQHPEWIVEALEEQDATDQDLFYRFEGGEIPFRGIENRKELYELLEKAPLGQKTETLSGYSQDGIHYYTITVLDKDAEFKLLGFDQVKEDKTIDTLYEKVLKKHFDKSPSSFTNDKQKEFSQVKENVSKSYFEKLHAALKKEVSTQKENEPHLTNWQNENRAFLSVYFLPHMQHVQGLVKKGEDTSTVVSEDDSGDLFKVVMTKERVIRKDLQSDPLSQNPFALQSGDVSTVSYTPAKGVSFFVVKEKGQLPQQDMVREKVLDVRELLSNRASCQLAAIVLNEMKRSDNGK